MADLIGPASAYTACVGGALVADDYIAAIEQAGFADVRWTRVPAASLFSVSDPTVPQLAQEVGMTVFKGIAETLWSYKVEARKP
jgi:hypothetical protein